MPVPIITALLWGLMAGRGRGRGNDSGGGTAHYCALSGCYDRAAEVTGCCDTPLCAYHARAWKEMPGPCPCRTRR